MKYDAMGLLANAARKGRSMTRQTANLTRSLACYTSAAIVIAAVYSFGPGAIVAMLAAMFILALVAGA